MGSRTVEIPVVDKVTFYTQFLDIVDPFNHIPKGEREVLSILMDNDRTREYGEVIGEKLLLDYDVKQIVMDRVEITEARLNNIIASLRRRGVIIKTVNGNRLHEAYLIADEKIPFTLTFKWVNGKAYSKQDSEGSVQDNFSEV